MPRPTFARVDLDAVRHNFRAVAAHVAASRAASGGSPPGIIAVVKANAYGHGAVRVAHALAEAGAGMLACADIEEGVLLRESGVRSPVLVFGALGVSDLAGVFTHELTPTVSTPSAARALECEAAARGVRLRCHLKIDTGMNRLGFRHDNLDRTLPDVLASPHLEIDAVYTHLATADEPALGLFDAQRERFDRALARLRALGCRPRWVHAANSAAILRGERVWFDFVRPGLLLYGVSPPGLPPRIPLRPVMTLRSRLVAVKGVRAGESVGYGARHVFDRPASIAVVPAGYADGLDLRLAGRGSALVRGRRVPIVGSVCMDMLTIDVTGIEVATGDEVVLLGEQAGARLDATDMAAALDTIPYEVLCRLGTRIERVYT